MARWLLEELQNTTYQYVYVRPQQGSYVLRVDNTSLNPALQYPETTISTHDFFSIIPQTDELQRQLFDAQQMKDEVTLQVPPFLVSRLLQKGVPMKPQTYGTVQGKNFPTTQDFNRSAMQWKRT